MTVTSHVSARPIATSTEDRLAATEQRLYDAETALHAARQTGVDAWVAAAYDRLHEAILEHSAALHAPDVATEPGA